MNTHNPDNLTQEQVGDGFRLLDEDEVKLDLRRPRAIIEAWLSNAKRWDADYNGNNKTITYRTRLSREELRGPDKLRALAERVAALNPDAGEIGAGMLKQLVAQAREALNQSPKNP